MPGPRVVKLGIRHRFSSRPAIHQVFITVLQVRAVDYPHAPKHQLAIVPCVYIFHYNARDAMRIRYWGTRGSIPSPGQSTARYGGNTSCVEVRLDDETLIILDAGSGIRGLGASLGPCRATILLSHYHWDHIQGLPFFTSAFIPTSDLGIYGPESCEQSPRELLSGQMLDPYFPTSLSQMAGIRAVERTPEEPFQIGSATVTPVRLCHPSVTLGYRIEADGASLVYMSDDEVDMASPQILDGIRTAARDADLLLHDCQYVEGEYSTRRGWGHSTPRMAVGLACEAGVRHLVLFHHDPSHSDEQVEAIADEGRRLARDLPISIAREGESMAIVPHAARVPAAPVE
jgi:phosphoribosyl 1,2-cyclic phosphodiesterase